MAALQEGQSVYRLAVVSWDLNSCAEQPATHLIQFPQAEASLWASHCTISPWGPPGAPRP